MSAKRHPDDPTHGDLPEAERRETPKPAPTHTLSPGNLLRTAFAGILMGVANLIPGVSGGTMILAMGLYEEFIDSVADITAFRFSTRRFMFLGIIGIFAAGAIVGLAVVILYLLFHHAVAMFALFIGLTLGGAPLLAKSLRPIRFDVVAATIVGFGLMVAVSLLKGGAGLPHNTAMDLAAGVVGSTTMVLPGISGSYMLLIMDQYARVVGAVDDLREALRASDAVLLRQALWIVIPVGIGVLVGIVALSNLLKVLLHRYHRATVGVLLGILLGSVLGLYPFGKTPDAKVMERRPPAELREFAATWQIPDIDKVADEALAHHIRDNWPSRRAPTYTIGGVALAVVLAAAGFAATYALARRRSAPVEDRAQR